jgi:hypothetical protein
VPTKKTCKAIASASGDRCKRAAVEDGYCKQHHKQLYPVASEPTIIEAAGEALNEESLGEVITQIEAERITDPSFQKYELAKRVAHTLAQSNLVPDAYRGRPNDVFVAINMGSELGMEPFQAIQSIAVIEGKPCLYGDGLIGVVRASPKCMWIKETLSDDGKTATCETQRRDDPQTISATYSMADAVQAGIDTKFNWKKHPKRMLQMRARAYCLRDAYPDLLKGLGVVEEHQDHDDTPPPVTQYDLPKATGGEQLESRPANDAQPVTLSEVERAIHQSDSMEELLAAGALAKNLSETDQGTARITYKKMRAVLKEKPND